MIRVHQVGDSSASPSSSPPIRSVTAPADEAGDRLPAPAEPLPQASEEEMAEVEAATKQLLDTRGGNFHLL